VSNTTQFHHLATPLLAPPSQRASPAELWSPAPQVPGAQPPSYDDSVADLPPDYTFTDAQAYAQAPEYTEFPSLNASVCSNVPNCLRLSCTTSPSSSIFFDEKSLYADIDFGYSEEGFRSHAKKKNNKAAPAKKPASNAADEGDKKKEEDPAGSGDGAGGDPPSGGDAGGGDGGDGSGGDKGGGGDSGKEVKKKTKKELKEEERLRKEEEDKLAKEEEERVAKEEEERLAKEAEAEAERKKKEDEDAAAAAAAAASPTNDLSWAEPATNNDDWGAFAATTAGKKKKGKKGKVRNLGCMMTLCRALTAR
jgi:hypothetical protein